MSDGVGLVRCVLSGLLFAWSLLAVFQAPTGVLWYAAIAATEFGHLFALAALLLLLPGWGGTVGTAGFVLGAAALILSLSPLVRAVPIARALPEKLAPFETPDRAPLSIGGLVGPRSDGVVVETRIWADHPDRTLRIDLFRGPGGGPKPVVLVVHGGSFSSGDRTQLQGICHYLAARGHFVAAMDYRLVPSWPYPAARDDVIAAIAWLKERHAEFGLDPDRIVLYGRSAGGQLVLLAAYTADDPAIRGVIALYAPSDMHWSWANPSNPWVYDSPATLRGFLGGTPDDRFDVYTDASPLTHVTARTVPTLLLHGGRDEIVFQEQSRRLDARLTEAGVPHAYVALPWATHGFDANLGGPGGQLLTYAVDGFLAARLRD